MAPPRSGRAAARCCLLLSWLAACAGPERAGSSPASRPTAPVEARAERGVAAVAPELPPTTAQDIDPAVLLPSATTTDDVVARVGDLEIHKRHLYEHLGETEPAAQRAEIDAIVLDAMVAQAAMAWGIRLDVATVDRWTKQQEEQLREVVERQLGGRPNFERYVQSQFGMSPEEHSRWLRAKNVRALYRQYVVRYAALLEDRVEVRYVVNSDRAILEDIAQKTRQGASFATLALRHTEDGNKLDRGLLPPFGRSFDHPVTDVAFGLEVGQLSDIFMRESQGSKRYYLVYCLRRIPGRTVQFTEVKAELDREIEQHPLTSLEFQAAAKCLESRMVQPNGTASPANNR